MSQQAQKQSSKSICIWPTKWRTGNLEEECGGTPPPPSSFCRPRGGGWGGGCRWRYASMMCVVFGRHLLLLPHTPAPAECHSFLKKLLSPVLEVRQDYFGLAGMPCCVSSDNMKRDHQFVIKLMCEVLPAAAMLLLTDAPAGIDVCWCRRGARGHRRCQGPMQDMPGRLPL
jgi:hypothetical protein